MGGGFQYLIFDLSFPGWCSVTPNNFVHTFDMLSMKMPEEICGEVVLVKDCSPLNLMMVTMKPTTTTTGHKVA